MMRTILITTSLTALIVAAAATAAHDATVDAPRYTGDGRLELPSDYREWVFLSSGIDMSYREHAGMADHSMFDNVFVRPAAYRAFRESGHWPDKTELVMEVRGAASEGSINKKGKFQTVDRMGVEVHVKDASRFEGGWAFFAFDGDAPASKLPETAACYACHRAHGAVDTTFVQFYPTLIGIASARHTLSAGFLDDAKSSPVPGVDLHQKK